MGSRIQSSLRDVLLPVRPPSKEVLGYFRVVPAGLHERATVVAGEWAVPGNRVWGRIRRRPSALGVAEVSEGGRL